MRSIILFFYLVPDFLFNADTICDNNGLILSTTFHAVHRKKNNILNI